MGALSGEYPMVGLPLRRPGLSKTGAIPTITTKLNISDHGIERSNCVTVAINANSLQIVGLSPQAKPPLPNKTKPFTQPLQHVMKSSRSPRERTRSAETPKRARCTKTRCKYSPQSYSLCNVASNNPPHPADTHEYANSVAITARTRIHPPPADPAATDDTVMRNVSTSHAISPLPKGHVAFGGPQAAPQPPNAALSVYGVPQTQPWCVSPVDLMIVPPAVLFPGNEVMGQTSLTGAWTFDSGALASMEGSWPPGLVWRHIYLSLQTQVQTGFYSAPSVTPCHFPPIRELEMTSNYLGARFEGPRGPRKFGTYFPSSICVLVWPQGVQIPFQLIPLSPEGPPRKPWWNLSRKM
ncbi:hypothetical protein M407DRAFT_4375 [Tulasnella calospora MUT 4182]|uniref:Uncharacterized protein n=1 Tax=Tulasnella calospora MUT 4182 TaxID=1051891 RepID=A0A0C3LF54_9AGAM|nr:hypothetical protein M407DRAFT_4375 [Tulasnella calospora MUT 4182]